MPTPLPQFRALRVPINMKATGNLSCLLRGCEGYRNRRLRLGIAITYSSVEQRWDAMEFRVILGDRHRRRQPKASSPAGSRDTAKAGYASYGL